MTFWILPFVLSVGCGVTYFVGKQQYAEYQSSFANPVPPSEQPGLLVLFSRPAAHVSATYALSTDGSFRLKIYDKDDTDRFASARARYLLIVTGNANSLTASTPSSRLIRNQTITKLYGSDGKILYNRQTDTYTEWRGPTGDFVSLPNYQVRSRQLSLTEELRPRDQLGTKYGSISGKTPPLEVVLGVRHAGRVPSIASPKYVYTSSSGDQARESFESLEMGGQRWYPAGKMSIDASVSTGVAGLPASWTVERVAPQTIDANELAWKAEDEFTAQWTVIDNAARAAADGRLFLAGVLFGACAGLVTSLAERLLGGRSN